MPNKCTYFSALTVNVPRLVAAFLLCGFFWIANGQTTTATLFGVVRDGSGAVVPEAKITARNTATSFERTGNSDETGAYLITNLPVGPYSLLIEKDGFRRFVQDGITLEVAENARVDGILTVGLVSDSITVSADATGVDTRESTVGDVVDRLRVQELPLNGRNVMQLARVIPGVTQVSAPTLVTRGRNGPAASVAGGRDTQNEIRFDDSSHVQLYNNSALNLPSPDALQEFKVLTSGFSAEYGRYGGGVFIAITRAGTNQFHGSLWEYIRNTAFDARNFFSVAKPDLKQNQFGFTFGGPVIHKRTFFFGSYQGSRERQSQLLNTATPPTAAERAGDFSALGKLPVDPTTKAPYPGGRIPSSSFDPVAVKLLDKYIPLPNAANGAFVTLFPMPSTGNQFLWRVDHSFSSRNSLNIRYFRDDGNLTSQSGNIPNWSPTPEGLKVTSWALHDTHTFTPSLLNEFRIGINRNHSEVTSQGADRLTDYGAIFPGVVSPQLPSITVTGFFAPATNDRFGEVSNIYQMGDTVRWFHGRHSISLGGEFTRDEYFGHGASVNQGVIGFGGGITTNAFADFLIGKAHQSFTKQHV
ncbi:MAG TPA: carboxypeptidase regulatory-like domain-containing protein [Candidatus Acidoferrales bacterium]|nr:carboxypeptidase regulatory-like domain-containing protein [Candidatus Acidoferrales bacterium]